MTRMENWIIVKAGLVVGPLDIVGALPIAVRRVNSWDSYTAPKSQKAVLDFLNTKNAMWESIFDASHGRRYMLFVYRSREERRACFDFTSGVQQ